MEVTFDNCVAKSSLDSQATSTRLADVHPIAVTPHLHLPTPLWNRSFYSGCDYDQQILFVGDRLVYG